MPIVTSGKVLVTGANGYIAFWVVKGLLEAGYSVRGTVRSESKVKYIKDYFQSYGDKLEIVVVENIADEGAFDEYVKDVDAIEHTASPFTMDIDSPDTVLIPAVAGTSNVLGSAARYGVNLKRIVVTSSTGAVLSVGPEPQVFSEKDWNDQSVTLVQEKGSEADSGSKYRASKTLAERAAWKVWELNKEKVGWDLTTIAPPFVYGPPLQQLDSSDPKVLNQSLKDWFNTVLLGEKDSDKNFLATTGSSWVDVRDLARAHILALQTEKAGGERIIVSAGTWKWQEWINIARKYDPRVAAGAADIYKPEEAVHMFVYDTAKMRSLFSIDLIEKDQCVQDMLKAFEAKGWWPKKA